MYDIIVIGGGPAGLAAAIYTTRRALKTLIVSKDLGGQAAVTPTVENYPGFDLIGGLDLMMKFRAQAEKFGAEFKSDEVNKIVKTKKGFLVKANNNEYEGLAVILAFGLTPRDLGAKGEEQLKGRGVSYCATCDGPLYRGKTVAVVGGGNSALEAAELLSRLAKKVYLIHRRDKFRGDEILVEQINKAQNVEKILNYVVEEVKGEKKVAGLVLTDAETRSRKKELEIDGIFIEVGFIAKTDFVGDLIKLNKQKEVVIDENNSTSLPGVYAAGDVTSVTYKQIVISAGEGAKAALQAYKYVQQEEGRQAIMSDWGRSRK